MRKRLQGSFPEGRVHPLAHGISLALGFTQRQSIAFALALAVGIRVALGLAVDAAVPVSSATLADTVLMLAMNNPESPFMESVERRRPGTSLRGYVTRTLPHSSAIVVANRAPHEPRPEGGFTRGAGGVITALLTFAEVAAAEWVACARTEGERALIEQRGATWDAPLLRGATRLHYATPTPEQYEQYYSVISNPVLWFVQHYLWDLANQPVINGRIHRAWKNGYVEVNKQVARKVVEVARGVQGRPLVMVHDYQLYLVPRLVREQLHGAIIQHFVHIPWPTPQYWKVLPREMRDAILLGLLGCDIVGFQTSLDVRNFLMTCEENAGLAVDERERAVVIDGRVVYARAYPISMDAMRSFDVLLVNSVYDGLNLVAKEGALVNRSDGVIVLSENVGAHEELHQHVLSVNPFDIEATANAMHQAVVMGLDEKRRRNEGAREVVRTNDIARWITRQVQDIRDLAAAPGLRAG